MVKKIFIHNLHAQLIQIIFDLSLMQQLISLSKKISNNVDFSKYLLEVMLYAIFSLLSYLITLYLSTVLLFIFFCMMYFFVSINLITIAVLELFD